MAKKLKIKLSPNGQVEMTTEGVKGKKCLDYIEFLEKIADVRILDKQYTDEYYETETTLSSNDEVQIKYD